MGKQQISIIKTMPASNIVSIPTNFRNRSMHALQAAAVHLLLSVVMAAISAWLIFGLWFPTPLGELMGGNTLFWLIVSVDVVCGPLLTLVVFNPAKPHSELWRDLALVALIQLFALGYGIHTLGHARPVALVHEVDRFRLVGFADFDEADAASAPDWAQPWSLSSPRTVGIRPANDSYEEKIASISASLQGVEPSQRPSQWQDYALSVPQVLQRARPLDDLRTKHPTQTALIDTAAAKAINHAEPNETTDPAALRWLPLVSRRATDWVVLLDPVTARVRGYIHLDGF